MAPTFIVPVTWRASSGTLEGIVLMWDFLPYGVNMFYGHWLKKNLLWPMAGQTIARQEIQAEIERKAGGFWEGDAI